MKKVNPELRDAIVTAYKCGYTYKDIQNHFGVNRWNIQDSLFKAGVKTNRISSPPRLAGGKKKKKAQGLLMDRYNDGDFLPPMKVNKNNPVLVDDLDYQERYDLDGVDNVVNQGYSEIVIDDEGNARYEEND